MAQSVSNDALWEKLSEIDRKLDRASVMQKTLVTKEEPERIKPDFNEIKEEIITEIKEQMHKVGIHSDANFEASRQNIQVLDENIRKIWNIVSQIRKQQRETTELQSESKEGYFNFKFFRAKKTSLMITVLGLLVFLLSLFCMKQQNDYSLLMDEYCRQGVIIKEMQSEVDSIKNVTVQKMEKKRIKK